MVILLYFVFVFVIVFVFIFARKAPVVGEGVPTLHAGNVCWASSCHLRLERRVEISFFRNLRSKLYFPERNSKGNGIGNSRNGTSLGKC